MDHKSQPIKCMYNSAYRMNKMNSSFCSLHRRKSQSLSRSGNVLFLSDHGCCSCLCDTVCLSHKRYGSRYNVQVHNDKAEVLLLLLRQTSSCGKQLLLICERRDIPWHFGHVWRLNGDDEGARWSEYRPISNLPLLVVWLPYSLSLSVSLSLLTPASYLCIPFALLYKFPRIFFSTCYLNKLLRGINRADGCHGHF